MRKSYRKFVYPLLGLALAGALALTALSTPWFRGVLQHRITASLEELTGARVEIGELRFNPLILHLTLERLVLHGTEPPGAPPLFKAETLAVWLNPISLWRREWHFFRLDMNGAELHLRVARDGTSNLPGPRNAAVTDSAWQEILNVTVGRLTINHSDAFWNDQHMPLDLEARGVAAQLARQRGGDYQGTISSTLTRAATPGLLLPPATFTSRFRLSRTGLRVTSLEARTQGIAAHGEGSLDWSSDVRGTLDLNAGGGARELLHVLRLGLVESGNATLVAHAVYEKGDWNATGKLRGRDLTLPASSLRLGGLDLTSDFIFDRRHFELQNLRVKGLGGNAEGELSIPLEDPSQEAGLRGQLQGIPLQQLLAALAPAHPLLGQLRWASTVNGQLDAGWHRWPMDLKVGFDLQLQPATDSPGRIPVGGNVRGSTVPGPRLVAEIQQAHITTPHSTLDLHGVLGGELPVLALELHTSDFEEWRGPAEFLARTGQPIPLVLGAPASFEGTVTGPTQAPEIRGHLALGEFKFRGWRWDRLDGDVHATSSSVEISSGHLTTDGSTLLLDASAALKDWELTPDAPVRVMARAEKTPLAGLREALGLKYDVEGITTFQVELQGTVAHLGGSGSVEIQPGSFAGQPFDTLRAQVHVSESVWNIDSLEVARGTAHVTGRASYNPGDRAFTVDLHARDLSPSDLLVARPGTSVAPAWKKFQGQLSFDVTGRGTPENASLTGRLSAHNLSFSGTPAGNFDARLDWAAQELRLEGSLAGPGGTLRLTGHAHTEGDWPIEIQGEYSDFGATPWVRLMGVKLDTPASISGTLNAHGPLRNPERMEVESQVRSLSVTISNLSWKSVAPIDLHYAAETLRVGRFQMQGPSTNLSVEGSLRLGERPQLGLAIEGSADATLLSVLDPTIQASGRSDINLRVNGSPARPLVFGTIKISDANLTYGDLPFHLFGLNGEVRLEGERATLQGLRGTSGGGPVTLQGTVTFADVPRFAVSAALDQVRVRYPEFFVSQLSGTLRLLGTTENSRLTGELTVRQLTASPNFTVLTLVSQVGRPLATPPIGVASPVAATVRLGIVVASAPTVRLETPDLRMVADVDLRIEGTLANPVVLGSIHVLNGETVIRGNRYRIDRGDINMTNPFRTQPMLDLEATTRVQRYDLTLGVIGPLEQIKMTYRSDPPLPTADILSLLALGYSREQQEMSTAPGERVSTVGASAILSEALSSQVSGRITRLFGVSRIKIDPNVGGPENISGARVTVEQQVTRDFTLTYITDTTSSQRRVIQFEWALSETLSLFGVRDQNGIFGVEVRLRKRFK